MPYGLDLANAAERHYAAGQMLDVPFPKGRPDVAGYLYGIAAECALKRLMWMSGMRPREPRNEDPFYLHFPDLKTSLRDHAQGRMQGVLVSFAVDNDLMNQWHISMRYAGTGDVMSKPLKKWEAQAKTLIEKMRTE